MKTIIRNLIAMLAACLGSVGAAETVRVSESGLVVFDKTLTAESAKEISKTGKMPVNSREFELKGPDFLVHLAKLAGKYEPVRSSAVVHLRIEADADCVQTFSAGCDWWFTCFINGEQVGTTEPAGNYFSPTTGWDHFMKAKLKKGVNHAAFYLRGGAASWDFAFRIAPNFDHWPETEKERDLVYHRRFPREKIPVVNTGIPVVHRVTRNSASFAATFNIPVAAGVRVLRKDRPDETPVTCWAMDCGLKDRRLAHHLTVSGLEPDTAYEYSFFFLDESNAAETVCRKGEFRTFPVKHRDHTLALTSDTQVAAKARVQMLKTCLKDGILDADAFVSLGDMTSDFSDFVHGYFTSSLNVLTENGYNVPFVPVRGNHEFRGKQTGFYTRCFGRPYYHFSIGDTLYLVLDSGEDKPSVNKPGHYTLCTDTADYFKEQAVWLKELAQTDEFKHAKRRIVLAHAAPFYAESRYMAENLRTIAGDLFYGKNAPFRLDLWICGHIHVPYRFDPAGSGENKLKFIMPRKRRPQPTAEDLENIVFPVYVNDGSFGETWRRLSVIRLEVAEDAMTLTCVRPDGKVIDKVRIVPGKPMEELNTK